jgi:hypothetical protein
MEQAIEVSATGILMITTLCMGIYDTELDVCIVFKFHDVKSYICKVFELWTPINKGLLKLCIYVRLDVHCFFVVIVIVCRVEGKAEKACSCAFPEDMDCLIASEPVKQLAGIQLV